MENGIYYTGTNSSVRGCNLNNFEELRLRPITSPYRQQYSKEDGEKLLMGALEGLASINSGTYLVNSNIHKWPRPGQINNSQTNELQTNNSQIDEENNFNNYGMDNPYKTQCYPQEAQEAIDNSAIENALRERGFIEMQRALKKNPNLSEESLQRIYENAIINFQTSSWPTTN